MRSAGSTAPGVAPDTHRGVWPSAPAAWDDPVGRVMGSLEEAGVPTAVRRLGRGEAIYEAGDPDGRLFFLLEGTVRVYKRYGRGGLKEATVALVEVGGAFGEPALSPGVPHRDCAEAISPCRVASVEKGALARHLTRDPGCALALLFAYGAWAQRREGAIARLVPREVRRRLANLLLELDGGPGRRAGPAGTRLTHQRMAEMVACTREAVSTEMVRLRREGAVRAGDVGEIFVVDRRALADIADAPLHRG